MDLTVNAQELVEYFGRATGCSRGVIPIPPYALERTDLETEVEDMLANTDLGGEYDIDILKKMRYFEFLIWKEITYSIF